MSSPLPLPHRGRSSGLRAKLARLRTSCWALHAALCKLPAAAEVARMAPSRLAFLESQWRAIQSAPLRDCRPLSARHADWLDRPSLGDIAGPSTWPSGCTGLHGMLLAGIQDLDAAAHALATTLHGPIVTTPVAPVALCAIAQLSALRAAIPGELARVDSPARPTADRRVLAH